MFVTDATLTFVFSTAAAAASVVAVRDGAHRRDRHGLGRPGRSDRNLVPADMPVTDATTRTHLPLRRQPGEGRLRVPEVPVRSGIRRARDRGRLARHELARPLCGRGLRDEIGGALGERVRRVEIDRRGSNTGRMFMLVYLYTLYRAAYATHHNDYIIRRYRFRAATIIYF